MFQLSTLSPSLKLDRTGLRQLFMLVVRLLDQHKLIQTQFSMVEDSSIIAEQLLFCKFIVIEAHFSFICKE